MKGEAYTIGHNSSGIKKGDKVLITHSLPDGESWGSGGYEWITNKNKMVGHTYNIKKDEKDKGFIIDFETHEYHFPFYVLQKIEEILPIQKFPIQIGLDTFHLPQCLIDKIHSVATVSNRLAMI